MVSKFQFNCHAQSVVVQRCRIIRQSGIQTVAAARCYDEFCTPVTACNHTGARTEQKKLVQHATATRRTDVFHGRSVLRILIKRISCNKLLPEKNVTIRLTFATFLLSVLKIKDVILPEKSIKNGPNPLP